MSIDIGLDAFGIERLLLALNSDHNMKIVINLLDRNENYLQPLTSFFWDGQVTIAANNEVSRTSSITLIDPFNQVQLDDMNVAMGSPYFDRMISVTYCVWQDHWSRSVDIPIFRGPITDLSRDGVFLNLECQGKERLAMGVIWDVRSYPVGYNKGAYVLDLMRNGVGEKRFALETTTAKLGTKISLGKEVIPWPDANAMANSFSMYLFYDGRGTLRMRPYPTQVSYTFRDGAGGGLRSRPKFKYDMTNFKNGVWVKGSSATNEAVVWAPADHPLSPVKLARINDQGKTVLWRDPMIIEDTAITSVTAAKARANGALNEVLDQSLDFSADVVVNPLLEEGDMIAASVFGEYNIPFRMRDMVIPLSAGSAGTIGNNKNVKLKGRV